ncbi:indolepyruvate ferredoxin oxidoreductase [Nitrobacteraceae bacterium AZCC 2161]
MSFQTVSLDDKYSSDQDRILISGTQALVRLPILQRRADRAANLDTAGYVTGYRGSPLGGLEQAFGAARKLVDAEDLRFQPGLNEDVAATAILGTQQINLFEKALKEGVFALWYGKGPGVDRSGDAFRHGNLAGTSPLGGVVVLAGDDHTCKSSTTSHQSEFALVDANIPILNPAGVQDIIDFGLFGFAMSRYSGCWSALKLVSETVDSSATINVESRRARLVLPTDFEMPAGGLSIRWPDSPQEQERRLHNFKIPAAVAFARANGLDRVALGGRRGRLGIVTTGKSYLDVLQALEELNISPKRALELGLSIYKVGMVWPLEPQGIMAFAADKEELLVVEEKRPLIESQIKEILYSMPAERRPRIFGKKDDVGRTVLPVHDDLSSAQIGRAIGARMAHWLDDQELIDRISQFANANTAVPPKLSPVQRTPYFCSGCPHNTSTRVPDGSRAMAGIGCHYLVLHMGRETATHTQMGGEGANWIGQAPYVPTKHIFQNMGDGTYFHSGLLAIRAAIAAKVNITYKILFNDAVAMTGGQSHDGALSPQRIAFQMQAEGVERIAIVSDDIEKYNSQEKFPTTASISHRDDLDAVQRELSGLPGVSVLIYDQVCAAEKRRRGKRAAQLNAPRRLLINESVCEGCGDCSKKSNCLSVVPVETEFGRKRRIDQSSCNTDYSCVNGFCPSFISVQGGKLRKARGAEPAMLCAQPVPEPALPKLDRPWNVLVTGVGGTGIVTIGAILAMAAHIEKKGCSTLDMTGMAQKGGPVTTHLRFASKPEDLHAVRISSGAADAVLACDMVVATGKEALGVMGKGRTSIVLNSEQIITSQFVRDPKFDFRTATMIDMLTAAVGSDRVEQTSATKTATMLLGDSIASNLFMVGFAYQRGLLPVSSEAIRIAINLNGAAVSMNSTAFQLGRLAAHDPSALEQAADPRPAAFLQQRTLSESLDETVVRRVSFLTDYQDAKYASGYLDFVTRVRARELSRIGSEGRFSAAVARSLFKLMAYKDEYEVARLYSGQSFRQQVAEIFDTPGRVVVHLAPPLLARRDPATGEPRKMTFGPWIFRAFALLARLKWLRGSPFDPFGRTAERKMERSLIQEYTGLIERVMKSLTVDNFETAVAIAGSGEDVAGFGHIKQRAAEATRLRWKQLEARLGRPEVAIAAEQAMDLG